MYAIRSYYGSHYYNSGQKGALYNPKSDCFELEKKGNINSTSFEDYKSCVITSYSIHYTKLYEALFEIADEEFLSIKKEILQEEKIIYDRLRKKRSLDTNLALDA